MKFEQYMKLIDDTHNSHVNGVLNEIEYINSYNEILDVVLDSNTISELEKRELVSIIKSKIGQVPKVEEMRKEAKVQELQIREAAFQEAKSRFRKLSVFQRVKLNLNGRGPRHIDTSLSSLEEINSLYRR